MLGVDAPLSTLLVSALGGLLVAAALVAPLALLAEGLTPARLLSAVRRDVPPEEVSLGRAVLVHLAVGLGGGLLFGLVYLAADLVPAGWLVPAVLGGSTLPVVLYVAFERSVLRAASLPDDRTRRIKLRAAGAAFAYGALVMLVVPALASAA